jgi:hypothetical protein
MTLEQLYLKNIKTHVSYTGMLLEQKPSSAMTPEHLYL